MNRQINRNDSITQRMCLPYVCAACVHSPARSLQPNSSTELEQKFQNNPQEVVEFTAGSQTYTLSFQGEATITPQPPTHPSVYTP